MIDSDLILLIQKSHALFTAKFLIPENRIRLEITKSSHKILPSFRLGRRKTSTLTIVSRFFTEQTRPPTSCREDAKLNAFDFFKLNYTLGNLNTAGVFDVIKELMEHLLRCDGTVAMLKRQQMLLSVYKVSVLQDGKISRDWLHRNMNAVLNTIEL